LRCSDAESTHTNVRDRAGVSVVAGYPRDGFVDAAKGKITEVIGAWVVVVTCVVIDETITVIIDAITGFRGGSGYGAFCESE